jgi:integrase/recombinase XerD
MKTLPQAVGDYLSLRRSLGFKLQEHERYLRELLVFLKKKRATRISTQLALEFATQHQHHRPAQWALRLRVVRAFACYRSGEDPATEIPPPGLLPFRPLRARPYLYSTKEIRQLLKAAQNMPATYSLKPYTYYCLFGLLALTGLRISEALNLQGKDVDWSEGVLTIHGAKFGKSRLIPLHPSALRVLAAYAKRRNRFLGEKRILYFFVSSWGTRLNRSYVSRMFRDLSRQIGLRAASASHGPRLHDFRHRFAVHTLVRLYRKGADVERCLPILSTYLGHAHVTDTYWYLTSTPELRGAAGKRMEKRWGGVL